MNKINFIYTINNLSFYTDDSFENLCSYLKSFRYNFIKLIYNETIEYNIKKIKSLTDKFNINLIISIKNIENIKYVEKFIDYIEIFTPKKILNVKNIILNISIKKFKKLRNKDHYFHIILNDIFDLKWKDIKKYELKKNIAIEFENKNIQYIYFTNFGINNFYISFNTIPNLLNEWSKIEIVNYDNYLKYNFNKIYKKNKKILITGITGQDGSNLVEYLINNIKDIIIFGTIRSALMLKHDNIKNFILNKSFIPIILDLCDEKNTKLIFENVKPDYFFNCAAQSIVNKDDNDSINTLRVNTIAPLIHLECIRLIHKQCRYFSCGSSEEFGLTNYSPQDLNHNYEPINIYGISKLSTHYLVKYYRNKYNLFLCHGILYNHEVIKRGIEFVSRKITSEVVRIKKELDDNKIPVPLQIGNIFSKRDWSDSEDFVRAFWKILNINKLDDYILSYGKSNTVKLIWKIYKNPLKTVAIYNENILVKINKKFYRKCDNKRNFIGDNSKSKEILDWDIKISFKELIQKMVKQDMKLNKLII